MPKYRLLTKDELIQLEPIFINFLAAKSITAQEWVKIKKNNTAKVKDLLIEFSDVVFEKTLSNIKMMEKRLPNKIIMYSFDNDKIALTGIEVEGKSPLDFSQEFDMSELNLLFKSNDLNVSFIEGFKPYFQDIKKEKFELMESGAMISQNDILFEIINKLKAKYS